MKASNRWVRAGALNFLARGFLLLILLPICGCQRGSEARRPGPPALDVNSTNLPRTRVVATLDAPLLPGTNLIWCASFQLAWKEFAKVLEEERPLVEGAEALCGQLNAAPDLRDFLPTGSYYAAAGDVADGIIERIHADMDQSFPSASLPDMAGFQPSDLVAYAFLEASMHFSLPYIDSDLPIPFRESHGPNPKVKMFGIGHSKTKASPRLRGQAGILFSGRHGGDSHEFALDLDRNSSPCQLILARLPPQPTLKKTVTLLESRMTHSGLPSVRGLGPHDTLLVPDMNWRIFHDFADLEGRRLLNSKRRNDWIRLAAQSVSFRLDRSGVALQSDATLRLVKAMARRFDFDRPFLVCLRKRGTDQPFFVAWIDNAELLRRWE